MNSTSADVGSDSISLSDKWTVESGRIFLNGTQAIARVLLTQRMLDGRAGLGTAGYISGYRGSPLGNVDTTLWSIADRLKAADILFQPAVNEDLAATAMRGTQQIDAVPNPTHAGVFAAWYGKGPGVDRSGDAFKHGNFAGAHRNGGVLVFYGDDHGGKSSTVAHHSEQAMAASLIPSLYPANVAEILEYGLLGIAMSRYSGSWVGVKCVNEVVEQTATVDIDSNAFAPVLPPYGVLPAEGVHNRVGPYAPVRDEQIVVDHRLPLVREFVRANQIDRVIFRSPTPRLALVTAGKSYGDTRQALQLLDLDERAAADLGISLYKVGCIWPLEPQGISTFARGHELLFVIEEKKSFIELQLASVLINQTERPLLVGKADEAGAALLPTAIQLEPAAIAIAIADRLERLGIADASIRDARQRLAAQFAPPAADATPAPMRSPFFCSGCPHSRSTRLPEGSLSLTGIGCHTMVNFVRPAEALPPTHMGGEGGNWIGLAPFTKTRHIFQNMGDGTYYHSGLLAIRAAVAAGVNITYKILYNDAVAMTGGQPVDGPISVAEIAQQVSHEGVKTIVLVSDDPDKHRGNPRLPSAVRIEHRDALDAVQRNLRDIEGCTVLIYEQTCAAEKRRRRKRGQFPDPPKRLFISHAVCEGCGDCSVQSTCVSLMPRETEFGTKRRIDQSSCNKDYSCLNGFCPSFITVDDAKLRKPKSASIEASLFDDLPLPDRASIAHGSYNILLPGIGGTGVITAAAIIAMAAHIEGLAASSFDMTGLAQKNGAVLSHLRIAKTASDLHAQRIGRGEADVLLAFDVVAAQSAEVAATMRAGRTSVLVNSDVTPTVALQFNRNAQIDSGLLLQRLAGRVGESRLATVDATSLATRLLGDSIGANLFLIGVAAQRGLLPIGIEALEQAVRLNGTSVNLNLMAFGLGRLSVVRPLAIESLLPAEPVIEARTLDSIIAARVEHLTRYQNQAYAARYRALVGRVREVEKRVAPNSDQLTMAVASNYAKLLAYKDEYEVARMLTDPELHAEIKRTFADGARLSFNLAPPILGGKPVNGRPVKRQFSATFTLPILRVLARLKGLRGTRLDLFGWSAERRRERELIGHYETLVDTVLGSLAPGNLESAVKLLMLADMIRGYGPVKETAIRTYLAQLAATRQAFEQASRANARAA